MDDKPIQDSPEKAEKKKSLPPNMMLFIIMTCWLAFYLYIGSQGGGG
ncbi:MAG: hypothetical protein KAR01_00265 [Desulfocapsa sp.]|nr:hypothetical protein [Desulfocapsa sp.]